MRELTRLALDFTVRVGTVQLIRGRLRPVVSVYIEGPGQTSTISRAMLDTGFSEYLALPGYTIDFLGLSPAGPADVRLANDQIVRFELYHAEVLFGGNSRKIQVHRTESEALVGMSLIDGSVVKIEARVGGAVELELDAVTT